MYKTGSFAILNSTTSNPEIREVRDNLKHVTRNTKCATPFWVDDRPIFVCVMMRWKINSPEADGETYLLQLFWTNFFSGIKLNIAENCALGVGERFVKCSLWQL
jgi:hypothetical protein